MKNVYMFSPNYLYGNDAYLPYPVASLAAYAWSDETVKESYRLAGMFFTRQKIESVVESLETPYLCAFANYIWNFEYNKALAKAIKEKFPSCIMVFGGHQISEAYVRKFCEGERLNENIVDIYVYDEGEIVFRDILKTLSSGEDLSEVSNLSYWNKNFGGGEKHIFTKREIVYESDFPSPYLTGFFDEIIKDDRYSFSATLETNRGCPYTCAYCDWGIYKGKLRSFPMERIKAEIDWFAEHKIDLVMGADSNFGILERDEEIADYLLSKHRSLGYPRSFRTSYAKNTGERIYRITDALNQEGMCKGATLSFQSLSPKTLEIIGRKNIKLDTFNTLLKKYHEAGIPTYSEIIMGLPGETLASFQAGVAELLNNGQHDSINIYLCELLTNSMMGQKDFIASYDILTRRTPLNQYHCAPDNDDIQEYSVVVVGNKTLPVEDWKECYLFSWAIQTFHCLGLTRFVAMYLRYEHSITYDVFYKEFLAFLGENETSAGGKELKSVREILERFLKNSEENSLVAYNQAFGNILWPTEEESFLEILQDISNFYQTLKLYLRKYNLEESLSEELLRYSYMRLKKPFDTSRKENFQYDFHTYFKEKLSGSVAPLNKSPNCIQIVPKVSYDNWPDFAKKIVWWGRKGGSMLYEESRDEIKIL